MAALDSLLIMLKLLQIALGINRLLRYHDFLYIIWQSHGQL